MALSGEESAESELQCNTHRERRENHNSGRYYWLVQFKSIRFYRKLLEPYADISNCIDHFIRSYYVIILCL